MASSSAAAKPYDSYRWARNSYTRTGRLIDIWRFVLLILFYNWLDAKNWSYGGAPSDEKRAKRRRTRAIWIRETMLHLGPTFIKVGQFFSTRADLFPAEYVEELSKLQDRVPAFDYELVVTLVERELGQPLERVYLFFDPTPLAAASLGQVHRAQIRSGDEVVVKVQRPGLHRLFAIDLDILRGIAEFFQYRTRWGKGGRDWIGIYEECRRTLWEEVDYLNEGRNADTFRRNFRNETRVEVPRVYWRYSSPAMLTLEYMPGIKVSDVEALTAAGVDRADIAQLGARAYLKQVLEDGFFHADPHPGNIAVRPDGTMIFYDFGMMGRVQTNTKDKMMSLMASIVTRDADAMVQAMIELGALQPTGDVGPVRRSMQYMLDNFMDQPMDSHAAVSMAEIGDDLYDLARDQPFRFPATFTFVMRAFSTLEGLGKVLDPQFNFMAVAQPYATELMSDRIEAGANTLIDQIGKQAAQFTNTSLSLPRRIEETLTKFEQGDIRVRTRAVETDRLLRQLAVLGTATVYAIILGTLLLTATQLLIAGFVKFAIAAFVLAGLAAIAVIQSLMRARRSRRL
ncbi:MAG: AarF/ABC1/UbiB kinase family protein [Cyanobacteria bacterium J06639_1]